MRRINPYQRRGVSMMLVLISLGLGTILATSFLASRDNSVAIGENIADAVAAKSAAAAGIELAVAILETASDWRVDHVNGKLVCNLALGSALIDIDIVDLDTQAPPTEQSTRIQVKCTCRVNGIVQTATAVAQVPTPESMNSLGVDLAEFAVFTSEGMSLANNATVTQWSTAPSAASRRGISVGTLAKTAGQIVLQNDAAMIDTTLYTGPGASGSLVIIGNSTEVAVKSLEDDIPMPAAPKVPVDAPFTTMPEMNNVVNLNITADLRLSRLETLANHGMIKILDGVTVVIDDRLRLNEKSSIIVHGNATIVVFNELELRTDASIEVSDGGSLTMYVAGTMKLNDAYIGNRPDHTDARDCTGKAVWMDPTKVRIFGSSEPKQWNISGKSVVKGSIYAPQSALVIDGDSAVYGRIAGRKIGLSTNASLFYDHSLNQGNGYTQPTSMVFDQNGRIRTEVSQLTSLDSSALAALADAVGALIRTVDGVLVGSASMGSSVTSVTGEPTPRTIPVEFSIISTGSNVFAMEAASTNGGWTAIQDSVNGSFDVLPTERTTLANETARPELP